MHHIVLFFSNLTRSAQVFEWIDVTLHPSLRAAFSGVPGGHGGVSFPLPALSTGTSLSFLMLIHSQCITPSPISSVLNLQPGGICPTSMPHTRVCPSTTWLAFNTFLTLFLILWHMLRWPCTLWSLSSFCPYHKPRYHTTEFLYVFAAIK